MGRRLFAIAVLGLAAAPLGGCGDERMERGLAAPDEEAVPQAPGDLMESAAERRQQENDEDDAASRRDFDTRQDDAAKAQGENP